MRLNAGARMNIILNRSLHNSYLPVSENFAGVWFLPFTTYTTSNLLLTCLINVAPWTAIFVVNFHSQDITQAQITDDFLQLVSSNNAVWLCKENATTFNKFTVTHGKTSLPWIISGNYSESDRNFNTRWHDLTLNFFSSSGCLIRRNGGSNNIAVKQLMKSKQEDMFPTCGACKGIGYDVKILRLYSMWHLKVWKREHNSVQWCYSQCNLVVVRCSCLTRMEKKTGWNDDCWKFCPF